MDFSNCGRRVARALAAALLTAAPAAAQVLEGPASAAAAPSASFSAAARACAPSLAPALSFAPAPALAPALSAPSSFLPSAPAAVSAAAAEPAAPTAATNPYAPAEEPAAELGDPVLTRALTARAEAVWTLAGASARTRRAFAQALAAADFTGARGVLDGAALRSPGGGAELPAAVARLRRALDLPDHPAVADVRLAARDAAALHAAGRAGDAMARVDDAQREFARSPAARTTQRWLLRDPLIKLAAEIRRRAAWIYDYPREARALAVKQTAAGVRDWLAQRRAASPDLVRGDYTGDRISLQKWSDCALQAMWNLPALRALHDGRTYESFVAQAEKILRAQPRKDGMDQFGEKRLLEALGWRKTYDAAPKGEAELARTIGENGGVLGALSFDMTRWQALLTMGSLNRGFSHAVAIPAAVFDQDRWWFVVLDSNYSSPRLLSYGELLTLGLKTATVAPAPPR